MISDPEFWQHEYDALLMDKNAEFLNQDNSTSMIEEAKLFKNIIEDRIEEEVKFKFSQDFENEETLRLLQLDAERTFKTPAFRKQSITTLKYICSHINDYHQGMGFISSFLLLFLDPIETSSIILALDKYYIPGYFRAAAKNYFRDAKVFGKILKQQNPEAYKQIGPTIAPETYCSKWFIGMNVHVLPFEALMLFLKFFFEKGQNYLFCYGISLINNCQLDIMATKDISKILAILRLDSKTYSSNKCSVESTKKGSFFTKIVEDALAIDIDDMEIENLREETELEMAAEEERRKKREEELAALESDDEITFSDEE